MNKQDREKLNELIKELNELIKDMLGDRRVLGQWILDIYEMYNGILHRVNEITGKLYKIIEEDDNNEDRGNE